MPKIVKVFLKIQFVANYKKMKGTFWKHKKKFRNKISQTRKPFFANWKHQKLIFTSKCGLFFFRQMSHSSENPNESSMLAKRFVSSKSRRGFDKKKFGKKWHSSGKNQKGPFSFVRFCKCMKTSVAEAVTRTCDNWVPAKPNNF